MDRVEHAGVVERTGGGKVFVRISCQSACVGCRARHACSLGSDPDRIVEVKAPAGTSFTPGDPVTVAVTRRMGMLAVLLAYVVPLVILITAISAASAGNVSDGLIALVGLGAVALYYAVLWRYRSRLQDRIQFTISR